MAYSYFDGDAFCSSSAESSQVELDRVLDGDYSLHYFIGSSGASLHVDPPRGRVLHVDDLNAHFVQQHLKGSVDVDEVFGGEAGVGKCCIRRRFIRGRISA